MLRTKARRESGATSAEYIGVLVFATVVVVAVITFAGPISKSASVIIDRAFCQISIMNGGGCSPDAMPEYMPTECVLAAHKGGAGGSIQIVVVEVGGDGSYELAKVRYLAENGQYENRWVVTTKGEGQVNGVVELGAGVTTEGTANAGASGEVKVGIKGGHGNSYEFDSEEDARDFVGDWKNSLDPIPFDNFEPPEPKTTFYEGGVQAEISGTAPGMEGGVSQSAVVGYTEHNDTGDRTVSLVTDTKAAGSLGIPLPGEFLQLAADGNAGTQVGINATFDEDGNLVKVNVTAIGQIEGGSSVGMNSDAANDALQQGNSSIEELALPDIASSDAGRQVELSFTTNFRRANGTFDHSAVSASGNALKSLIRGESPSAEDSETLRRQLNEHSQVTMNTYDYDSESDEYGLEGKLGPIVVGGEVHITTEDRGLLTGYYHDPTTGQWEPRTDCQEG